MKKLSLDIDGVVADIHTVWCKLLSLDEEVDNITTYDYLINKYGEKERKATYDCLWENLFPHVTDTSIFRFLEEMSKLDIQVDYVTKRDILLEYSTEHWLQINGLTSNGKLIIVNSSEEKIELGYDYYVDDCPAMIELIKPEQTLFLYNQQWNKDADGRYIRVITFDDVREYFLHGEGRE